MKFRWPFGVWGRKRPKGFHSNVFSVSENGAKRALLCMTNGSMRRNVVRHTSSSEALFICEALRELGIVADVAETFRCSSKMVEYGKYDLIIGFGPVFEASFVSGVRAKRIFYCPGCSPIFQTLQSIRRVRDFYEKTGVWAFESGRLMNENGLANLFLSDRVVVLGNEFTVSTMEVGGCRPKAERVNLFYFDAYDISPEIKDYAKARKHLVWFGSLGAVHKGLDLLLEVVKKRPELTLHICGFNPRENSFADYYQKELGNVYPNIVNHGFVDIMGADFRKLMEMSGAVVFPSASEGGSPALLNVVANGALIPVVSRFTGVDFVQKPFVIEALNQDAVEQALDAYLSLGDAELLHLAQTFKSEVRRKYSAENYRLRMKQIVAEVLTE